MKDLIKTLGLREEEQVFVPLNKEKTKHLSIVLEKSPYMYQTDAKGKIQLVYTPGAKKLNCAIQDDNKEEMEFLTFYSEEEYYEWMSKNCLTK